jgi:hypothetical protein
MLSDAGVAPLWDELVATALLGVERQQPPTQPTGAPELDAALAALADREPAARLLGAAALLGPYRRAGQRLAVDDGVDEPSPVDDRPACGAGAAGHLVAMLGGEHAEVLPEWLGALNVAGKRLPPRYLPSLLDLGAKQRKLRDRIEPVLGQRGRWLARQNSNWRWALPVEDEALWRTGDGETRLALLRRLRDIDPDRARELLRSTWAEEAPDDRLVLLNELGRGLSMADEPFLEDALDDRRGAVRQRAAELLAQLPGSRLVGRMTARAQDWLGWQPDLRTSLRALLPGGGARIDVRLPAACDKAMQRAGVDPKPPGQRGERAWWLHQVLAVVPLGHWVERWGAMPAELVAAALRSEEAKLLVEAFAEATRRQRDPVWARALLDGRTDHEKVHPLIGLLPPEEREARVLASNGELTGQTRGAFDLMLCDHAWSPALSRAVLAAVLRQISASAKGRPQTDQDSLALRHQLDHHANHLDPALADEAAALRWPTDSPSWGFWANAVDAFLARLRFRHEMIEEIAR